MFGTPVSTRRLVIASLLVAGLTLVSSIHAQDTSKRGRKYKAPPATAHFEVTVVRATTGKPVENASVIFHPLENGHDNGNMELKTNDEGKAMLDLLPIGSQVRLQIIAQGFQTYGEDMKVDKDTMSVEVKLKRPAEQYSIYKKNEGKTAPGSSDKPADPKTDKPDAPKSDTPSETKPDAPKDAPKPQS
jgi:hypothetical protein